MSESVETAETTLGEQVLVTAGMAWALHGDTPDGRRIVAANGAEVARIVAPRARRIEFVVESDDQAVWEALACPAAPGAYQRVALVPLALLGVAHERLRAYGYELQGWWVSEDVVRFGAVEIA